jgi:hypothetical protein
MTALFMEGFENVIDNIDLIARGWHMGAYAGTNGQNAMTVPSRTGTPGKGLMLKGPYYSASLTYLPLSLTIDFGMMDTGIGINSLWKSGGFAVGMNGTFNKASQVQVAANGNFQIVYDGATYYWAIVEVGSTYEVAYSPDLINWTTTTSQPANIAADSTITVVGSGATATVIVGTQFTSAVSDFCYTTNQGITWTAVAPSSVTPKMIVATGNSATPYVMFGSGASTNAPYTMTSISATPTAVSGASFGATGSYNGGIAKIVAGYACFMPLVSSGSFSTPSTISSTWWFCSTAANMAASASYTSASTIASKQMNDITFFNNTWITVGYGGVFTAPNPGTSSNILPPTAAWANPVNTGTVILFSVASSSTMCVAVGIDSATTTIPAIYTSPDGVNWTKTNRFTFEGAAATNSMCFMNVIWTGTQFVMTGGLNSNVIATSPDGIAWTGVYYPDYTEVAQTTCASAFGIYSGAVAAGQYGAGGQGAAGTFTPWSTSASIQCGFGFYASAPASGARTVQAIAIPGGTQTATVATITGASESVSTSTLSHYYEIIATATGTTNAFTFQFAIDGVILPGTSAAWGFAAATDTTGVAHLVINLPRSGNWTVLDDIYVTNFTNDGSGNVGQLGVTNVLPWVTSGDVSDQWTRSGSQSTDAACVAGPYSNSEGYVYATAVGAKDTYQMSASVPAGFKVRAVQAEGYFAKNGSTGANASVGIVSGSTELDSSAVSATTSTAVFASVLASVDPNTGTAWTNTGAAAAEIAINKTS